MPGKVPPKLIIEDSNFKFTQREETPNQFHRKHEFQAVVKPCRKHNIDQRRNYTISVNQPPENNMSQTGVIGSNEKPARAMTNIATANENFVKQTKNSSLDNKFVG